MSDERVGAKYVPEDIASIAAEQNCLPILMWMAEDPVGKRKRKRVRVREEERERERERTREREKDRE